MRLDRKIWYVGWFFWSLAICDVFLERNRCGEIERRGTNLCFFFRTIFISAPLILALHVFVYGAVIVAVTVEPIHFFGAKGYTIDLGVIAVATLSVIGLARHRSRQWKKVALYKEISKEAGFANLFWEWIIAQKKKVCPLISFEGQEEVKS